MRERAPLPTAYRRFVRAIGESLVKNRLLPMRLLLKFTKKRN